MEKGVIVRAKLSKLPSRDVFEWYVLNDSGGLEDPANWPAWNEWRHIAMNKAKYIAVLELIEDARKLPPPEAVGREELIEDAARDEGGGLLPH